MPNAEIPEHDPLPRAIERFMTPRRTPPTQRDERLLAAGTTMALNCQLAATSWGSPEAPTVLLAHGWNSRRSHWSAFVPELRDSGFRVVAVDAPAHGDSPGDRANVLAYGKALRAVGEELGPLAGIVGHSFGAGAAVIALHHGLAADRAVLICGPASLIALIERWCRRHQIAEDEIPRFLRRLEQEVGETIEALDIPRLAPRLHHPTLVVHDRGDEEVPVEDGVAVASACPRSRLMITERYGHRRILLAKEVVRAVNRFLTDDPSHVATGHQSTRSPGV